MGFFTTNTNKDEVTDYTGGNYINKSGMYPVTIKHAIVNKSPGGSVSINLLVDYEGTESTIYSAYLITQNDGKPNAIGQSAFNKLCCVLGLESVDDPVAITIPMGKDNKPTEVYVLEEFADAEVVLHIKRVFSVYKEAIRDNKEIRNVFRAGDFATAAEILNERESGAQYAVELTTCEKDVLRNDLTQEDVDAYLADKSSAAKREQDVKPTGGFTNTRKKFV